MKRKSSEFNLVTIRVANVEDSRAISSLLFDWLKLGETKARLAHIGLAIREREILVALNSETKRVIGFIHGILHNDPISSGQLVFVTAFYVHEDFREMGVGSRLLKSFIARAEKNGAIGAEVSTASRRAINLYSRFGFKQFKGETGEILLCLDFKDKRHKHL